MTEENTTNNEAQASQDSTVESVADKMFDANKETENNADEAVKGEEKESNLDTSESTDETKEGEESKDSDEKVYDDLELPDDLPEGIEIDEGLFSAAKEIGEKHNIPKEAMQELINTYADKIADADKQIKQNWADTEKQWKDDLKADKEIGGDNLDNKVEKAKRAISVFGTPELKQALEQTRMGNHPELIRLLSRIGEKITEEGGFDHGSGSGQRSRGDILFDNS